MSKFIAFDLDGTLVDADELHFIALNKALAVSSDKAPITRQEHTEIFKGLPTRKKLEILIEQGRIPPREYGIILQQKQMETLKEIQTTLKYDPSKTALLSALKEEKFRICVCSNAVRASVRAMLVTCGLMSYLDFFLSNQDTAPKPAPDMYLQAAHLYGIAPDKLIVVEDAEPGQQSALAAGCRLIRIAGPDEVHLGLFGRIYSMTLEEACPTRP